MCVRDVLGIEKIRVRTSPKPARGDEAPTILPTRGTRTDRNTNSVGGLVACTETTNIVGGLAVSHG